MFAPQAVRKMSTYLLILIPVISSFGTACFALAYNQDFWNSGLLAAVGLTISGMGYFWLVARYNILLARTQRFRTAVLSVAFALIIKLVFIRINFRFRFPGCILLVGLIKALQIRKMMDTGSFPFF